MPSQRQGAHAVTIAAAVLLFACATACHTGAQTEPDIPKIRDYVVGVSGMT